VRRAALIAIVLAGCGGSAPPAPTTPAAPAPTTTDAPAAPAAPATPAPDPSVALAAQVEAVVGGYQAIARAVGPAVRCPQVATAIADVATSTAAARAAVGTASRGDRADEVDGLLTAAEPRLAPALVSIDEAAARCAGEPAVARALAELDR
jgi:hypothetical protein